MFSGRCASPTCGSAGHDHLGGPVPAGEPGARGGGVDEALCAAVVEHVLAEVPNRPIVGLGVEVQRDLLDAPVDEGHVLRDPRLDPLVLAPLDHPRLRQQRGLRVERLALDPAAEDHRAQVVDGEERVGDLGGIRERRRRDVDPFALGRHRELVQVGRRQLGLRRLRDRLRAAVAFASVPSPPQAPTASAAIRAAAAAMANALSFRDGFCLHCIGMTSRSRFAGPVLWAAAESRLRAPAAIPPRRPRGTRSRTVAPGAGVDDRRRRPVRLGDHAHDRQPDAPPRCGCGRRRRARSARTRAAGQLGREARPLVADVDLDCLAAPACGEADRRRRRGAGRCRPGSRAPAGRAAGRSRRADPAGASTRISRPCSPARSAKRCRVRSRSSRDLDRLAAARAADRRRRGRSAAGPRRAGRGGRSPRGRRPATRAPRRRAPPLRIAASSSAFSDRQRCAELVARVGHEPALALERLLQAARASR